MNGRQLLERLASCIVLASLSLVLGVVPLAEGAELKFRPASAVEPVIARYLVTLDTSINADDAGTTAESLTHSYGGRLESYAQDPHTFAVTMTPSRARTLSSDPRVRTVVEVAQPDRRLDEPSAPLAASLASNHLVSRPLSTSGVYAYGAGNIKAIGNDTFVYDGEQRLVDATVQGNRQTYVYDIYGNRTSATRVGNAINCLGNTNCEAPVTVLSSTNHLDNVTYDEAGNVLTGYGAAYVYDGTGMVTQATVGTDIRNFAYTADDERIAVRQGLTWSWTVTRSRRKNAARAHQCGVADPVRTEHAPLVKRLHLARWSSTGYGLAHRPKF